MKKVLVLVLAVAMLMSMALPVAALSSPSASAGDLLPGVGGETKVIYVLLTPEQVAQRMGQQIQDLMAEAKAKLKEACPEGFAVKYFFYVDILVEEESVSVEFEPIAHNEIVFKQYVNGEWTELDFVISDDGTISVLDVVENPIAIFTK